jgi:hypothetical protein
MSYTTDFSSSVRKISHDTDYLAEANALRMIQNPLHFSSGASSRSRFFSVRETPVLFKDAGNPEHVNSFPDRKVIVNLHLNQPISIVRADFLVVKHEDAFRLGERIFEMLFGVTPQVHKERLSSNHADYRVDLISEECKYVLNEDGFTLHTGLKNRDGMRAIETTLESNHFNMNDVARVLSVPKQFSDEYFPFIRVSNFLREGNSMYIELGFYRARCSNGMLLGMRSKTIFRQSYYVDSFLELQNSAFDFFSVRKRYMNDSMQRLWKMLSIGVSREQMRLIPFAIFENELLRKTRDERSRLIRNLDDLVNGYAQEIGENLNAALNVATDFSKTVEGGRTNMTKLQRACSQWMYKVTGKTFNFGKYIESLEGIEERIMTAPEIREMEMMEEE